MLPQDFTERMKKMLKEEYPQFIQSYEEKSYRALRFNSLKAGRKLPPFHLTPVPWAPYGYYYEEEDRPGKAALHEAGVYYIQEASAMLPAVYLDARPGERVLDLCAAPGGKSTQIASAMQGEGILVCNEIHPARAQILSENIERMGISNAIVMNESPQVLAEHFPCRFDRILVDAPCSGEGMFRKNPKACEEWTLQNVGLCAERQDEIMDAAAAMLRPGGRLVYSTCTFAPDENEGTVSRFIKRNPEFSIEDAEKFPGMSGGVAEWVEEPAEGIEKTVRLWPHKIKGEGHYAAVLLKEKAFLPDERMVRCREEKGISEKEVREYTEFCREYIHRDWTGILLKYGEQLYLAPTHTPSLQKLRVLRPGLHMGTLKKNRFEPAHALALALGPEDVTNSFPLDKEGKRAGLYLSGQTFHAEFLADGEKGWYLMQTEGYSLGWGKLAGGIMKNHYPKGLRKNRKENEDE